MKPEEIVAQIPTLIQKCTVKVESADSWGFPIIEDKVDGDLLATHLTSLIDKIEV